MKIRGIHSYMKKMYKKYVLVTPSYPKQKRQLINTSMGLPASAVQLTCIKAFSVPCCECLGGLQTLHHFPGS